MSDWDTYTDMLDEAGYNNISGAMQQYSFDDSAKRSLVTLLIKPAVDAAISGQSGPLTTLNDVLDKNPERLPQIVQALDKRMLAPEVLYDEGKLTGLDVVGQYAQFNMFESIETMKRASAVKVRTVEQQLNMFIEADDPIIFQGELALYDVALYNQAWLQAARAIPAGDVSAFGEFLSASIGYNPRSAKELDALAEKNPPPLVLVVDNKIPPRLANEAEVGSISLFSEHAVPRLCEILAEAGKDARELIDALSQAASLQEEGVTSTWLNDFGNAYVIKKAIAGFVERSYGVKLDDFDVAMPDIAEMSGDMQIAYNASRQTGAIIDQPGAVLGIDISMVNKIAHAHGREEAEDIANAVIQYFHDAGLEEVTLAQAQKSIDVAFEIASGANDHINIADLVQKLADRDPAQIVR